MSTAPLTARALLGLAGRTAREKSDLGMHDTILDGLAYATLVRFQKESGLPLKVILDVTQLPPRTLARRKEAGRLAPDESDRLYRLVDLYRRVLELFHGDREATARWLRAPRPALGGHAPIDLARTEIGARQVEALIGKLEHGVFV